MNDIKIRCISNPECTLGEGPLWDAKKNLLYWVDILENKIYSYDAASGTVKSWTTNEHVGFVIIKQDGSLIAGLKSGLHNISLNDDTTVTASRIDRVDENLEYIRFNDGMSDKSGGIWACTMDMRTREPLGKYFYYDQEYRKTIVDEGYVVANGPAISPDERFLYTVETVGNKNISKGIYVSEITSNKTLANRKLLIDWNERNTYPDGLITDTKGNLWIAEFSGNTLRCYSCYGELKTEIPLPAWNVTKAAIGGEKGDVLYVTSSRIGVDQDILANYPYTGGIIEITGAF